LQSLYHNDIDSKIYSIFNHCIYHKLQVQVIIALGTASASRTRRL